MLARKQELNTQVQQLNDALLLAVSVWVSWGPGILRHILVRPRLHSRSIPELLMAFRDHHAVRTDHAGFTGLLSIAAE